MSRSRRDQSALDWAATNRAALDGGGLAVALFERQRRAIPSTGQQGGRMTGPDRRSDQAAAYRALYRTAAWQNIRSNQLAAKPLCEWCSSSGRTALATVCDHAQPHRGDPALFHNGPFLSLCKTCHDGAAQRRDRRGYSGAVNASGWPIDPNHPSNRKPQRR